MGAKKKGKGSKLARMSEEERLRYLQHRAALEEEARRRKEQLIATYMKNKLKREEAFSRLNVAKINQQWRQILRRYKCVELRQDLEALFKWFVNTASNKTKQIDQLLDDLDEADNQYQRIYQCHIEIIDRLLDIHQQRIDFFRRQFEEDRREIYHKATNEMSVIVASSLFDQDHLKAILFRVEEAFLSHVESCKSKHVVDADELRNNMLTELENLVISREAKIEKFWQTIQATLKSYWESTEDRRRQYIALRDADFENCKQIFNYYQQINNAQEVVIGLKDQLLRTEINAREQFAEMRNEKEECHKLFNGLRKKLNKDMDRDRKQLTFLTTTADDVNRELQRIHGKGDQILQILALCKKLELIRDKIPDGVSLTEEQKLIEEEESTHFKDELTRQTVANFSKLDNFWKQFNQVMIEKEALAINIKALELEQKELKSSLRSYISEVMMTKPSARIRVITDRPFTTNAARPGREPLQKVHSYVPYVEATQSPSIRHMIRLQSGK